MLRWSVAGFAVAGTLLTTGLTLSGRDPGLTDAGQALTLVAVVVGVASLAGMITVLLRELLR